MLIRQTASDRYSHHLEHLGMWDLDDYWAWGMINAGEMDYYAAPTCIKKFFLWH